MPELGPYGSMRGEVRENLPYRGCWTLEKAPETRILDVRKVSLIEGGAPCACVPNPRSQRCVSWHDTE
jgi:hypothetical protein